MKYWIELKEWGQTKGSRALSIAKIKTYLNAPIMANFDNINEEACKFLVSRYHDGKIWINHPIEITPKLINFITRLPVKGDLVLVRVTNMSLVEKFIGSSSKVKNSKGLQINSIEMSTIKWVTLIVSIYLTASAHSLDVKLNMLEAIDNITYHSKV